MSFDPAIESNVGLLNEYNFGKKLFEKHFWATLVHDRDPKLVLEVIAEERNPSKI